MDKKYLPAINAILDSFFEQSIEEAFEIDPSYERLWKRLHSLIQSGGKRLRPQMTLFSYKAFGGEDANSIINVAAAQELLHFSLLIHDDIIDRDYVRYGTANIAGQYKSTYLPFVSDEGDLTHYAHGAAILAGDLMLSRAHHLITESSLSNHAISTAHRLLSRAIFEVAGGELLDTELSFMPYKNGSALNVARYKTAGYSFITPLITGAELAHASKEQCLTLRECAIALGIAYQLTDDLLGVFGDESKTGKSVLSDITEGKRTYLVEAALDVLLPAEKEAFMVGFGNLHATNSQTETVKHLLESSGAKQKTEEKINDYTKTALDCLASLRLSAEYHEQFFEFIQKLTTRNS